MHPCVVSCSTMCSSMYTNRSTYTCVTLDTHLKFFCVFTHVVPYEHVCGKGKGWAVSVEYVVQPTLESWGTI